MAQGRQRFKLPDLEINLEEKCRLYAEGRGALFFKFTVPGNPGAPDRLLLHKGKVIFVEMKRKGGKPSEVQLAWHKVLRTRGYQVEIVDDFGAFSNLLGSVK